MPVNVDWRVGPSGETPAAVDTPPEAPPRRRRSPARLGLALVYLMALGLAALAGFQIGRWSDARAANLGNIENQIEIERLAWREGDGALFRSTLDPAAPPPWQQALVREFEHGAPRDQALTIRSLALESPDRARVVVVRSDPAGTHVEERVYRLTGRSWYRTPDG